MKRSLTLCIGLLCFLGTCASSEIEKQNAKNEIQVENESMSEENAMRRAKTHLALKQWSWGEPEKITEKDDEFFLVYKTPKREKSLIGSRTLVVDKETGVVSLKKRR